MITPAPNSNLQLPLGPLQYLPLSFQGFSSFLKVIIDFILYT